MKMAESTGNTAGINFAAKQKALLSDLSNLEKEMA
jgi:hypothetical protein